MRMFPTKVSAVAAAVVLLTGWLLPGRASASLVSHSSAGTLIDDGFEGDTVGSFPTGWTVINRAGTPVPTTADVDVENGTHAAPTPPAAYQGVNFLAVRTDNMGAYQTFSPLTTGIITAKFAVYLSSANSGFSALAPTFLKSAGVGIAPAAEYVDFEGYGFMNSIEGPGTIATGKGGVNYYNNSVYAPLTTDGVHPFTFTLDAWHEVIMTDDIAAGSSTAALTITVDGITLAPLPTANGLASGSVDGFQIYENTNGTGFLDQLVPEPSSVLLLGLGGLLVWRRVRRAAR